MAVQSLKSILSSLITFTSNIINSTNNPTNVTAAQAGAYSKSEVDTLLTAKLSTTALPLAMFGDGTVGNLADYVISGKNFTVRPIKALLGGVAGTIDQTLSFSNLGAGATSYISLEMQNGALLLVRNDRPVVESNIIMAIGTVTAAGPSLTFTGFRTIVRIAGYRLSFERAPNSIPISDGNGSISAWL